MSISVTNLTKIFGTQHAVDDITFTLKKGEIVGFLGPNGAGKSTTMKMITGYLPPTSGSITVCGMDVTQQALEIRKKIGYLPESNPLYYDMYVREYLDFSAGIHRLGSNKRQVIDEMISLTGLTKEAHKKIGTLSKGYKQRVGLAQAMLHNPEVLVLDEPTSGLDPNQLVEIRDLILRIGSTKTVLLSTHIMQEVQAMCSRVIIINNGKLVADDTIDVLKQSQSKSALLVRFDAKPNEQKLKGIAGVKGLENLGNNSYRLHSANPEQLRKELMKWAIDTDTSISSLQIDSQSLEEAFRSLTTPATDPKIEKA